MAQFIKVTVDGENQILNVDNITRVFPNGDRAKPAALINLISFDAKDGGIRNLYVDETYEQIVDKIQTVCSQTII